jgi:hypothetical protein
MSRLLFLFLSLAGCDAIQIKSSSEGSSDPTTGGGGGGEDDVDTECDIVRDPAAHEGPGCVTEALACGDTIVSTTEGGAQDISGAALQSWFCVIAGDSEYLGPERVYSFTHPGDSSEVTVTLSEPCGGLELFVMSWADTDSCPVEGTGIAQCDDAAGTGQVKIWDNEERRYLVIVDGADEPLPFSVSLECP